MQNLADIDEVIRKLDSKLPVCRVCLNLSMEYIEFDSAIYAVDGADITYFDAFQLVQSQAKLFAGFETLCSSCGNDLLNAFLFRQRVENADVILNKICYEQTSVDIKSLDMKTEKEYNESPSFDLLSEEFSVIEENFLQVDIFTERPKPGGAHMEFTEISKVWPSSTNPAFTDAESESHKKGGNVKIESFEPFICLCNDCGEKCTSREVLNHGSRCKQCERHRGKKSYCSKSCEDTFQTKNLLTAHTVRCHKTLHKSILNSKKLKVEKKEECTVCLKMVRKSFMEIHKEVHFGPRNSMCTECGKQFGSRLALRTHSLIHKQSGQFLCHICNKICQTMYALKSHIQFKHIIDKSLVGRKKFKYQCEDCGLIFQYPSKLRVHQRKHNAETPYMCPHCSRSYLRKDQFNIHMRYHNNDLPHKCDQCDKSYATKNNLSEHRKSVHDNVTYSCDKCDQKFKSVTGLRKHKFVHTGYPYVCPICGLGQPFRSGIKAHLLRVHKDTFTEEEFNETFPVVIPKSGFRRPKL